MTLKNQNKCHTCLEDHVYCCSLGTLAVGCIHLAEVPFDSEEDLESHDQTIGVFLVVGSDRVGQVAGEGGLAVPFPFDIDLP